MSFQSTPFRAGKRGGGAGSTQWVTYASVFTIMCLCGYGVGYLSRGRLATEATDGQANLADNASAATPQHKWKGDTIHSVLTSSGDAYQNWQTRIMYASYKLVQKEPGGERLTGFTRILHRTVPDVLMEEVPTFHAYPEIPACDGWCEYPVANRPGAIKKFFEAAAANESLIQGAWVFMLECDYVWMQPMQVPGSAWDPDVPGVQFYYDYIIPAHPNALPSMKKLYDGDPKDIPASGPSPVLMRLSDWIKVVPTYYQVSKQMEADEAIKKALEWVREMYAWDVALARHPEVKMLTEHPPNSTTIVQPPFDEALNNAAMTHYTWGVLYHEGLPSKGAKQVYRFEKRDFNQMPQVCKPSLLPEPPEYKDGWILEFDSPLNRKRHDLSVLQMKQMNRAIATLPDLTAHWQRVEEQLRKKQLGLLTPAKPAREAALAATMAVSTHTR